MSRLLSSVLLLLLLPSLAFSQTIKLPAEINVSQNVSLVQPEFSDINALKEIKWAVLGLKVAPSFSYLEPPFVSKSKSGIMLRSPAVGDEITIVVVALWNNGKLSDPVITNVKRGAGASTPPPANTPTTPTAPAQPPPAVDRDLPANTRGISAIVVVDPAAVPPDVAALGIGQNAVTSALVKGGGALYIRNSTDSLITRYADIQAAIQGKPLPVVVVIDAKPNPRKVFDGVSFTPKGSADLTARQIITQIANVLGP